MLFYQAVDLVPEVVGSSSKPILSDRTNTTSSPAKTQPNGTAAPASPGRMDSGLGQSADANGHGPRDLTASLPLPTPIVTTPPSVNGSSNHHHLLSSNIPTAPSQASVPSLSPQSAGATVGSTATPAPTPSSSSFTNTLFGKIVRPPSGVLSRSSPTPSSQHQQTPGDSSQAVSGSAHTSSNGHEKENKSGGGWFSRPRRKESIHAPIPVPSLASSSHSDAGRSNSSLPDIKPRSSKRLQPADKIITSNVNTPSDAVPPSESRRSPVDPTSPQTPLPRSAGGGPNSPSVRPSFDKLHHGAEQSIPPVPPFPDVSTASLASSTLAPPSSTSSSPHHRRKSLTKHAGNFFSRPRSGHNDTFAVPSLLPSSGSAGSQPPSPIVQPTPPQRHPRRVASVLHISSPFASSAMTTTPSRSRPPSSTELHASMLPPRPDSMVTLSPTTPSPISNHLAMPTSSALQHNPTLALPPAPSPPATTNNANSSHGTKRASRKMSFSGPGGFWVWHTKDKDKES